MRGATASILAEPQFHRAGPSSLNSASSSVSRFLDRFFGSLLSSNGLSIAGVVVAVVVVTIAVVLAARFATRVTVDPTLDLREEHLVRRRPLDWKLEAAEHEARGEWRDALRCHYRALVAEMADQGVVDEIPGRTSGEYEWQVSSRQPELAPRFAEASDMFESAWYGYEPSELEDAERFKHLAASILSGAGR